MCIANGVRPLARRTVATRERRSGMEGRRPPEHLCDSWLRDVEMHHDRRLLRSVECQTEIRTRRGHGSDTGTTVLREPGSNASSGLTEHDHSAILLSNMLPEFHKQRIGVHETPHPVHRDVSHEHGCSIRDARRMCQGCTSALGGLPSQECVRRTFPGHAGSRCRAFLWPGATVAKFADGRRSPATTGPGLPWYPANRRGRASRSRG